MGDRGKLPLFYDIARSRAQGRAIQAYWSFSHVIAKRVYSHCAKQAQEGDDLQGASVRNFAELNNAVNITH